MRRKPSHREPRQLKSGIGPGVCSPRQQQAEMSVGRAGFPRYRDAHSGTPGCDRAAALGR